jgi:hypothetical protein
VSIDLSTPGNIGGGATILVASGLIVVATGELPCSSLATRRAASQDRTA